MKKQMTALQPFRNELKNNPNNYCKKIKQLDALVANLKDATYDEDAANEVIDLIETFVISEESVGTKVGDNLKLLAWQKYFLGLLFGFKKPDGENYFLKAMLFVAKKNGKTHLISALALINLLTVQAAQVVIVNSNYTLAKVAFDAVKNFIITNPVLNESYEAGDFRIDDYRQVILYYPTASKILVRTDGIKADTQGLNASLILFDEIALYSSNEIVTKLESGRNRKNAVSILITTAETNTKNPAYFEYERSEKILNGVFDMGGYLPMIFELDQEDLDKWDDRSLWIKANPSLGIIRDITKIEEALREALQNETGEAGFKAYFLNLWSSEAKNGIKAEDWKPIIDNKIKYKDYLNDLTSYPVAGGLDLSLVDDFTAYTLYFYIPSIDRYYAKHQFFIPDAQIERKMKRDSPTIRSWIKQGLITACYGDEGGKTIDFGLIAKRIEEDFNLYPNLQIIGGDPVYLGRVKDKLPSEMSGKIVDFVQAWTKMGLATSAWYQSVLENKIIDDNPVMRWMVSNGTFAQDANKNLHFQKVNYQSSPNRIDGIITSIMALALLKTPTEQDTSYTLEDLKAFYDLNI